MFVNLPQRYGIEGKFTNLFVLFLTIFTIQFKMTNPKTPAPTPTPQVIRVINRLSDELGYAKSIIAERSGVDKYLLNNIVAGRSAAQHEYVLEKIKAAFHAELAAGANPLPASATDQFIKVLEELAEIKETLTQIKTDLNNRPV